MDVDLVFEGGGILGISYVGALKKLENTGYNIQRCAGTSAGAAVAALIAAGYTGDELEDILFKGDYSKFTGGKSYYRSTIVGKMISLFSYKGVIDNKILEDFFNELLVKKGKTKFKDVMVHGNSRLKIIASDITRRKMVIIPDDLVQYNIDPLEFSISKAVAMSCSMPLVFTPVKLMYGKKVSFIVDGGILSNFPIWIFDTLKKPICPTFGIKVKDLSSNTSRGKTGFISYVKDLIEAPLNQDSENFVRHRDEVRTIEIDNPHNIKATDFNKINLYRNVLYKTGYECTQKFLNGWNFNRYVQCYSPINE